MSLAVRPPALCWRGFLFPSSFLVALTGTTLFSRKRGSFRPNRASADMECRSSQGSLLVQVNKWFIQLCNSLARVAIVCLPVPEIMLRDHIEPAGLNSSEPQCGGLIPRHCHWTDKQREKKGCSKGEVFLSLNVSAKSREFPCAAGSDFAQLLILQRNSSPTSVQRAEPAKVKTACLCVPEKPQDRRENPIWGTGFMFMCRAACAVLAARANVVGKYGAAAEQSLRFERGVSGWREKKERAQPA